MNIQLKLMISFVSVVILALGVAIYANRHIMQEAIYSEHERDARTDAEKHMVRQLDHLKHMVSHYLGFLSKDFNLSKAAYYGSELGQTKDLAALLPKVQRRLGLSFLEVLSPDRKVLYSSVPGRNAERLNGNAVIEAGYEGDPVVRTTFDTQIHAFIVHTAVPLEHRGQIVGLVHGGYLIGEGRLFDLAEGREAALYYRGSDLLKTSMSFPLDPRWVSEAFAGFVEVCGAHGGCIVPPTITRRISTGHSSYTLIAVPLLDGVNQPAGTIVIAQDTSGVDRGLADARDATLHVGAGVLVLAFLLSVMLAKRFASPITRLKDATIAMGRGDFDARVAVTSNDELGVLERAFNSMGDALGATTVSKNYVENILGSMADALIVIGPGGRIKKVNRAALNLLGYEEQELLGRGMAELTDDAYFLDEIGEALAEKGKVKTREAVFTTKDGRKVPVQFAATDAYADDDQPPDTVILARDITERLLAARRLEAKQANLERSNKELDQFAYVVSHDLKAPLRAIANLSQWIGEDLGDSMDENVREQMRLLRGRVHRMEGLINGVLEYSRIGRIDVDVETVNIKEMLDEIIDSMPVHEGFTIHVGPDMPVLRAASVRLSQVFSNLISNALKYCGRDDGRVDITVRDVGGDFEFAVADNGPGIAPQYHEKIFGIFQTLEARDKVESTGVGLSLVKKIVEEQGGHVTVESQVGQGAMFRFTWPKQPREKEVA